MKPENDHTKCPGKGVPVKGDAAVPHYGGHEADEYKGEDFGTSPYGEEQFVEAPDEDGGDEKGTWKDPAANRKFHDSFPPHPPYLSPPGYYPPGEWKNWMAARGGSDNRHNGNDREAVHQPLALPLILFLLLFSAAAGMIGVLASYDANAGDNSSGEGLEIEEVFFRLEDVDDDTVKIVISVYITNYGGKRSGDILLNIYAENTRNKLVYDRANKTVEAIEGERTVEATIPIELPRNNTFRIKVILFEKGMIKITGYGEVSLGAIDQEVEDFLVDGDAKGGSDDDDTEGDELGASGFEVLLLVFSMAAAAAAGAFLRRNGGDVR